MELAYEAFTETCTFGLDEAGVCVRVTALPGASKAMLAIAGRCLGAQYVASLDAAVEGLLSQLPKPGTRLLFARTEDTGRIVLVRSGPLQRFEARPAELPTVKEVEPTFDEAVEVEAPRTLTFQEEETAPFSRFSPRRPIAAESDPDSGDVELEAVTRRSPSTVRGFPPPPAHLSPIPLVRLRNPVRTA